MTKKTLTANEKSRVVYEYAMKERRGFPTLKEMDVLARRLRDEGYRVTNKSIRETWKLIKAKRERRRERKPEPLKPLRVRFEDHLLDIALIEIADRGLSTPTGWENASVDVMDYVPEKRLWVVHAEYRYEYSKRYGAWWQGASYLCGKDEGQYFAVRVPKSILTVEDALDWLIPADVHRAREKGLPTFRQGDMFFAPKRIREDDMSALAGSRHRAVRMFDGSLCIVHPEHKMVYLPKEYKWRAYASTQIHANGRTNAD